MAHATEYAEHRNRLRRPSFDWCKEPTEAFLALTSSSASTKPLLRIRTPAKKTFGEAFGAATGVSDPRLEGRLCRRDGFFWAGFRATGVEGC